MRFLTLLFLSFLSFHTHAGVTHFEVIGSSIDNYPWVDVCERSGVRHHPLIEARDLHRLDCMGITVVARDFCQQRFQGNDRSFLRAIVNNAKKTIDCHYGQEALISYQCRQGEQLCAHEKDACAKLGGIFARGLKVSRAILQQDGATQVSCHFSNFRLEDMQELKSTLSAPQR